MKSILWCAFVFCLFTYGLSETEVHQNLSKLSRANAYFADNLYKQLRRNSENFVFSPLGISYALSMIAVGAGGSSLQELRDSLGFSLSQMSEEDLLSGYRNILTRVTETGNGYQFNLTNALFLQNDFAVNPNYIRHISEDFKSEFKAVNFSDTVRTLNYINEWIKNATQGKIENILRDLDPMATMTLLDAIYFKGQWINRFEEENTSETVFTTKNGTQKLVHMMSGQFSAKFEARHAIGGSVIELPYKNDKFSMTFILPQEGENIDNIEQIITYESLLQLSSDIQFQDVLVGIPKIRLESEINLVNHFEGIGITHLVTPLANLSRISNSPLQVSEAVHKATLELTEEGCEASSVTGIVALGRSKGRHRPSFWANRPFMFLLRHNPTNMICFMGRVLDV